MKRLHVHVSVPELTPSIDFYSKLFASAPTVVKTDYAKWVLEDPRVNFAISRRGAHVGLNHLGIQVEEADDLGAMHERLQSLGTDRVEQTGAACCYAKSDKYWVQDPAGLAWETFHTLDAIPVFGEHGAEPAPKEPCCIPLAKTADASPCCVPSKTPAAGGGCC